MSLVDEARQIEAARLPGPICSVQKAIRDNPDLADQIAELISDRSISQQAAENVLQARRMDVTRGTISRHRDNKCQTCKARGVIW